jgi:adenosine deaminase
MRARAARAVVYGQGVRLDLHRHLEGSHSPAALLAVAQELGLKDPLFFDAPRGLWRTEAALRAELELDGPSDDALRFYACIKKARVAYASTAAVRALALRAFLEAAEETDGFEMRVSLFSMTRTVLENQRADWRSLSPVDFAGRAAALLEAVLSARDEATRKSGTPTLVRLGLSRTFESEAHYRALAPVIRERRRELTGLDVLGIVVGDDKEPMPAGLATLIDGLRADLPDLTIHAGEFEGPASVERTLALRPQAIGHGVRSVESPQTLERLRAEGVTLEVCPHSNHLLIPTALAALRARHGGRHPLCVLQAAGVHAVLGSDDPTPMGTDFRREWARAVELGADERRLEADSARRWAQLPGSTPPAGSR